MLTILVALLPLSAQAAVVPGNFPNSQAAITAVVDGTLPDGTIIGVEPGTYTEGLSMMNSSASLPVRAIAGPASTTINAKGQLQLSYQAVKPILSWSQVGRHFPDIQSPYLVTIGS